MVVRENMKNNYALISVYDKSNLKYLCNNLKKNKYKFISTGSTCKKIKSLGFDCIEISKVTKFKEILDGRVKTLNPKIYGSILFKRNNKKHSNEFKKLQIPKIDIVVVNLYPFKKFLNNKDHEKTIEMIDIGGVSLLRASSKNYKYVTTISNTYEYKLLIQNLRVNKGFTDLNFRKEMATSAFKNTAEYDKLIYEWMQLKKQSNKKKKLRYGENPNQKSFILNSTSSSIFDYQISGKEIGYNNIIDVDSGIKCLKEFTKPTCIIIKHNNPCGAASSNSINLAFKKAYESDSKSAFGGVVLLNRKIDESFSNFISKFFFEVIVAPSFEKKAVKALSQKKKLILLKLGNINLQKQESRSTLFGTIYQNLDNSKINKSFCKLVAHKQASVSSMNDIIFGIKVVKHLKSNAIVLVANEQTVGIGNGQTNRVGALEIAIKGLNKNFKNKKFICTSDGFFPFTDSLSLLKKNKCKIVATPSGSINDRENIMYANKKKISLYFIKNRLFKH